MFNLIVVVFSVVLVAALAITSLSFIGPIFGEGSDRAEAAQIINEATQISGAATIARGQGKPANSLNDLEAAGFLRDVPSDIGDWRLDEGNLVTTPKTESVCRALNIGAGVPDAEEGDLPLCSAEAPEGVDYYCCEEDE